MQKKSSPLKKILIGILILFIGLFILSKLFPVDYYKKGLESYKKNDFRKSLKYLENVKTDDKDYNQAIKLIKEINPIIDSLEIIDQNERKKEELAKIKAEKEELEQKAKQKIEAEKEELEQEAKQKIEAEKIIKEKAKENKQKEIAKLEQERLKSEKKLIIQKLKKKAKINWPNDYTTQEFWINEQIESYEYMSNIQNNSIKRQAQRDWPLDFSTQKFWYNEQIEAKERLER